jgi:hypothetical protein
MSGRRARRWAMTFTPADIIEAIVDDWAWAAGRAG